MNLDAQIAETVMGLPLPYYSVREMIIPGPQPGTPRWQIPNYSTNIADAFKVVEKMHQEGWCWRIIGHNARENCMVEFSTNPLFDTSTYAYSTSLPTAICEAALAALRAKENL